MPECMDRAADFIWKNARLLDRQRFAHHFLGGSRDGVVSALQAYQNDDGGFGNALEPDMRCPTSQPQFQEVGLRILDEVGFGGGMVEGACNFLQTIATDEGGVPWALANVDPYPHAPWWAPEEVLKANINPTGAIAGLLHKRGVHHAWLAGATEFCWRVIDGGIANDPHGLMCVLTFLENAPDQDRARAAFETIGGLIFDQGLVCMDPDDPGYVKKPLDWAPRPESWCRALFNDEVIGTHLDALEARQAEDGGWCISWEAVSPSCELEWRGVLTVDALLTMRAYGRLGD
ncbi:MAG TPA: hypothetical protein QGH10_04590 [Armatimonadota bacterium]|nr:hypothetical protein [Armatimonadota bacterium]